MIKCFIKYIFYVFLALAQMSVMMFLLFPLIPFRFIKWINRVFSKIFNIFFDEIDKTFDNLITVGRDLND